MNDHDAAGDDWEADQKVHGWIMPSAPRWKRLPIIRHVRALICAGRVRKHEQMVRFLGMIPSGYDQWVLYGIWKGRERHE